MRVFGKFGILSIKNLGQILRIHHKIDIFRRSWLETMKTVVEKFAGCTSGGVVASFLLDTRAAALLWWRQQGVGGTNSGSGGEWKRGRNKGGRG